MSDLRDSDRQLAEFEHGHSAEGLFLRYARGRITHFWHRQLMTLSGAVTLALLIAPRIGLAAASLALLGEAVDLLALRLSQAGLRAGGPVGRYYRLTALSAGFQALTIVACIALAAFTAAPGDANFFCFAYLAGAALNAGLVLQYHPLATWVRLGVYGCALVGILAIESLVVNGVTPRLGYDLLAIGILVYMVWLLTEYVSSNMRRHIDTSRALLQRQRQIETANAELRDQQARLRYLSLVARHAADSVLICGPDRRIEWVNDAFTRITGYTRHEAVGRTPGDLLNCPGTDPQTVRDLERTVADGKPFRAEILNRCKDGREIWVDTTLAPLLSDQGALERVVSIERDITDAKRHEAEMAAARIAAESSERAKSAFLATMSHEIRTPMNAVIGMADLLCETALDADQRLYADTIRTSAEALLKIINDILDLSKLEAGRLSIDPVDFAPGPCVLDAVDLLRPRAEAKGLELAVEFRTRLPAMLHGDDGRLRQILVNLTGNAIKFTEQGSVTILVSHRRRGAEVWLRIEVRDTGIGIPSEKCTRIFDPFAQADAATTRRFGGTGLGLAISRLLARQMGGDISLESHPGQGSCFRVEVQLHPARGLRAPEALPEADLSALAGLRVLLAEDNGTNRLLVQSFLKGTGVLLEMAPNGRIAVERAAAEVFDVILMDLSMPELDGLGATRAIRARGGHHPRIVALTANAFASDRKDCHDAGMDAFLSKPVRKPELLATLAEMAGADPAPARRAAAGGKSL
ncbi:MAG: PAS domain-containing hybrid sensor histidine kinase/response regulator [Rhodobacteraceae bacterium]|nr:MAG: PAS domain-containing hybrid sensor histidine kinase/response regulator [Paracoccaceae bacterium]